MNSEPRTGGAGGPDKPHEVEDVYGGVWANCGKQEDTTGEGSAPCAPAPEHKSFAKAVSAIKTEDAEKGKGKPRPTWPST